MDSLNYHHLRYFRAVANEGSLRRAAEKLNLSQSALSMQIRQLESRLGQALFDRVGRRLELTEVGRIALDYADRIFETGAELMATLQQSATPMPPLRVGALSTLSRNFQMRFLAPALARADLTVTLRSGSADTLIESLRALMLDVVLSTEPPRGAGAGLLAHRLAEQPVGLHGRPDLVDRASLRDLLSEVPLILPTETAIRTGFEGLTARLGVTPRVAAEVDDMAMVRLLARAGTGVALASAVVLADELAAGTLADAGFDLGITETFYALTFRRSHPHPLLAELLSAPSPH